MKLFDAHCHLQFPQYNNDLPDVLVRMQERGVGAIVVGTDYETSKAGLELAKRHDFLWASVGLHPNDNVEENHDISKYEGLAQDPKVVAIGECGLDYFRTGKTADERRAQLLRFEVQLQLALRLDLPLIIHCRDAHEDMLTTLAAHRRDHGDKLRIIMHFFTGSKELASAYLDLGCFLSFPGPITYTDMYDESIRATPLDRLLVETDAPFAAPAPHRGARNEPAFIEHVAAKVAAVKGMAVEDLARQIVLNSQRIFNIDK